jgi:hypothetical protein
MIMEVLKNALIRMNHTVYPKVNLPALRVMSFIGLVMGILRHS